MSDSNSKQRPNRHRIYTHLQQYEIKVHPQDSAIIKEKKSKKQHGQPGHKKSPSKGKHKPIPQFRIKKLKNKLLQKLVSLLAYTIQSADKAMIYIPLSTYFDANFQTRLYFSDRENLMNWLNALKQEDVKLVDKLVEGKQVDNYMTVREQYYKTEEDIERKSARSKSQSIPKYHTYIQTNQQIDNNLQPMPQNDIKHCSCNKNNLKTHYQSCNTLNTRKNKHPHDCSISHHIIDQSTAEQIRKDIERLKSDIQQLRKMKHRSKSSQNVFFEEKISIVEERYKKCEDKVNFFGNSNNNNISNNNNNISPENQLKPLKIKIPQAQFISLEQIQKQYKQIQSFIKQKLQNLSSKSRHFTKFHHSQQSSNNSLFNKNFLSTRRKSSLFEEIDLLVAELEKDTTFLAQVCEALEKEKKERVYDRQEIIRKKNYEIEQLKKTSEELKKKLQQNEVTTSTNHNHNQPHSTTFTTTRTTIIQPPSHNSDSLYSTTFTNKLSRLQSQLSVCKNNFRAFFTIIKNIIMRYPAITNNKRLDEKLLQELRMVEVKDGKVEKGMEILVKLLDSIVGENIRLMIDAQARQQACNKSFTYIQTRIQKNITSHILDELQKSRHSISHSRHPHTTKSITTTHISPSPQQQLSSLQLQLTTKDQTILKLSQLLQAKQLELFKIKIHVQKHQDHKVEASQVIKHQNYNLDELRYILEEREFQLGKVKQQVENKNQEIRELEKYLNKVQTHAVQVREENSKLKDIIDEANSQIYNLKDEKQSILDYVSKMQIKQKNLQQIISDKDNQILQLKNILREYQTAYKQLQQRYYDQIENKLSSFGVNESYQKSRGSKTHENNRHTINTPTKNTTNNNNSHILIKDNSPIHTQDSQQQFANPSQKSNTNRVHTIKDSYSHQGVDYLLQQKDLMIDQLREQNEKLNQKLQDNLQLILTLRNQCKDLQAQINLLKDLSHKQPTQKIIQSKKLIQQRSQVKEESSKNTLIDNYPSAKHQLINEQPIQCQHCIQKQNQINKLHTQNSQLNQKVYQLGTQLEQLRQETSNHQNNQQKLQQNTYNTSPSNSITQNNLSTKNNNNSSNTFYRYHNMINQQLKRQQQCDHNNIETDTIEDNQHNLNNQPIKNQDTPHKQEPSCLMNQLKLEGFRQNQEVMNLSFNHTPREIISSDRSRQLYIDRENQFNQNTTDRSRGIVDRYQGLISDRKSQQQPNTSKQVINTSKQQLNQLKNTPKSHHSLSQLSHQSLSKPTVPHPLSQQSQQDKQLLKRNRGDQRPSFLIYRNGSTLFSQIGLDSQRQRVKSQEDIEKVSQIVYDNRGRQTDRSHNQSDNNNSSKRERRKSIAKSQEQIDYQNHHYRQNNSADDNSPKKPLKRQNSDASLVQVDLNNDYRNDPQLQYYLNNNNNNPHDNFNLSQPGLIHPVQHKRNTYQQVKFDMNPIRENSQNSQSTSKVTSQKERQSSSIGQSQLNNNQHQVQVINEQKSTNHHKNNNSLQQLIQNLLNPTLSNQQVTDLQVQQKLKSFLQLALQSRDSSQQIIKQLIHIIKSLRQQIQLLTSQYQSLNHQYILYQKNLSHPTTIINHPSNNNKLNHNNHPLPTQQILRSQLTQNISCLLQEYDRKQNNSMHDTVIHQLRSDHLIDIDSKNSIDSREDNNFGDNCYYLPMKIVTQQEITQKMQDNQDDDNKNRDILQKYQQIHLNNNQNYNNMFDPENYAVHMLKRNPFLEAIHQDNLHRQVEPQQQQQSRQQLRTKIQQLTKKIVELQGVKLELTAIEKQKQSLITTIHQQSHQISTLTNHLQYQQQQSTQLHLTLNSLHQAITQSSQKILFLQQELKLKSTKLIQTQNKLNSLMFDITNLQEEMKLLEENRNKFERENYQLKKSVVKVRQEFRKELDGRSRQVDEIEERCQQLERNNKQVEQKHNKQSVQYTHILNQYHNQHDELTKANSKTHELEQINHQLQNKINQLQNALKQSQLLNQQNQSSHQDILNQQIQQIEKLHSTINDLQYLKHQHDQLNQKIQKLQEIVAEKDQQLHQQKNQLLKLANQVHSFTQQQSSYQKQLRDANNQISSTKRQLSTVKQTLLKQRQSTDKLSSQNNSLSSQNAKLTKQSTQLKQSQTKLKAELTKLELQKISLQQQDNKLIEQLKTKVISLMNIINQKQSLIKENQLTYQRSIKQFKHSLGLKEQQNRQLISEINNLKGTIKTIETSFNSHIKEQQSKQENINKMDKSQKIISRSQSCNSQTNNRNTSKNNTSSYSLENMIHKHKQQILALHKLLRQKDQQLIKIKQQPLLSKEQLPECNYKQLNQLKHQLQQVRKILSTRQQNYNQLLKEKDQVNESKIKLFNQKQQELKKLNQDIIKLKNQEKITSKLREQLNSKLKQIQSLKERLDQNTIQLSSEKKTITQLKRQNQNQTKTIQNQLNQITQLKKTLTEHSQCTLTKTNQNQQTRISSPINQKKQLFEIHNFVKVYVKNPQQSSFVVTQHHDPKQQQYHFEICSHQHMNGTTIVQKSDVIECKLYGQEQQIRQEKCQTPKKKCLQNDTFSKNSRVIDQKHSEASFSQKQSQHSSPHKTKTDNTLSQRRQTSPQRQNPSQKQSPSKISKISKCQQGSKSQTQLIAYPPVSPSIATKPTNRPVQKTQRAKSLNCNSNKSGELNKFYLENIVPQFFGRKKI